MEYLFIIVSIFLISSASSRNLLYPCDKMVLEDTYIKSKLTVETLINIKPPLFTVECAKKGITAVPDMIPNKVEYLDLCFNFIQRVKVGDFRRYTSLKVLLLRYNCVKIVYGIEAVPPCHGDLYIESGAFEPLHELQYLDISWNYLREFPLVLPSSITFLSISATFIGNVTDHLQHELPNLTVLFAIYNCIQVKPAFACPRNFTISSKLSNSLQIMYLSYNNWHEIPNYLFHKNLQTLDLSINPIGTLQKEDFQNAENLKVLILSGLLALPVLLEPGALDPLIDLRYLDLSANAISYIPEHFFKHNAKLEHLDLSYNCLEKNVIDPTYLINLAALTYLDVSINSVCTDVKPVIPTLLLGEAYSSLKSLRFLMLGFPPTIDPENINRGISHSIAIERINSKSFLALSKCNISVISLAGCSLQTLVSRSLQHLPNLMSLYSSFNQLNFEGKRRKNLKLETISHQSDIKWNFLKNPKKPPSVYQVILATMPQYLTDHVVDYSHNLITTLQKNETMFLKEVFTLDLSYNQISSIYRKDFQDLPYLTDLNLANNPLKKVDSFAFQCLTNLRMLYLTDTMFVTNTSLNFLGNFPASSQVQLRWKGERSNFVYSLQIYFELNSHAKEFDSIFYADFSDNEISTYLSPPLIPIFKLFPSLLSLSLRNCEIMDSVSTHLFMGQKNLIVLDLSHNKFYEFPTLLLQNLSSLTQLDLSSNCINTLSGNFFENRTGFDIFEISNNKISYIEPHFFKQTQLLRLDLRHNRIQRLGADVLSKEMLNSLTVLDIRWNELDCGCEVWQTFYLWYISDKSSNTELPGFMPTCTVIIDKYFGGCVACQSPWGLRGKSVSRHGYNTSCEVTSMSIYAASFTAFILVFMVSGAIGYSKWFKRMVFRKVNDQFRVKSLQENIELPNQAINRYKSFVFYDHENDEVGDWVDGHLVPAMKRGKPSINLVVVGRDDYSGIGRAQSLLKHAMKCHKTIVLLSNDFCNNPTCRFLIAGLQELQFSEGSDRLILITWYGDRAPGVSQLIQRTMNRRRHCFLRFDYANDDERMFFDVLKTHLLAKNDLNADNEEDIE